MTPHAAHADRPHLKPRTYLHGRLLPMLNSLFGIALAYTNPARLGRAATGTFKASTNS
ncbi:hypothetical protein CBOM_07325 [Ceraceosorus bombacis]|uniref:Uncharacterized protein n=1 Tax=Ceraceosorus bombacis TaxID=401625 RepID=A0A0P1B7T7_9BASI|nr:hypothetical protein CBOM_07325 [Ceraceosorus bombacis]